MKEETRLTGLVVDYSDALKEYASAINKSRDELTKEEKQQAILNAVLKLGEKEKKDV